MTNLHMTASEAVAKLARGEITVLDVREANELAASGTAAGGVHIPSGLVGLKADPKAPDLDPRFDLSRPVAVFCAAGGRAGRTAEALAAMGYTTHNIGGFSDWVAAGGPVSR